MPLTFNLNGETFKEGARLTQSQIENIRALATASVKLKKQSVKVIQELKKKINELSTENNLIRQKLNKLEIEKYREISAQDETIEDLAKEELMNLLGAEINGSSEIPLEVVEIFD